jgi:hypothetical protein
MKTRASILVCLRPQSSAFTSLIFLIVLSFLMLIGMSLRPAVAFAGALPTRSSGSNLPLLHSTDVAPTGSTRFLSFEGDLKNVAQSSLLEELEVAFIRPLEDSDGKILFSYIAQTSGEGHFFLHLVLEPSAVDDVSLVHAYVAERELSGFRGLQVRFSRVVAIFEVAHLQTGVYVDAQEDPFQQDFELVRSFAFMSLRSWKDFNNEYGFALLSHDSTKFLDYLTQFVSDPVELAALKSGPLTKANMVAIDPKPYLILENDASVGPAFDESPFLPYKMFRNCYSPSYENGMCVKN